MEQGSVLHSGHSVGGGHGLTRDLILQRLVERRGLGLRSDVAIAQSLGMDLSDRPAEGAALRAAAVLVPLVDRPDGLTVLLTQRTDHLNNHAGQVSFPGGRLEDDDADAEDCALRETEEETGLSRSRVEILGRLDDYVTVTNFRVVPVVGLVTPPLDLAPDPFEVAEVFEVPLDFLLDPANHRVVDRKVNGRPRPYYAMPYDRFYIWGATAGMLMNLYNVLKDEP